MATSQFTLYSSGDPYGPGPIYGSVGDLIRVLDSCLVDGYSGKPAAGWTKPIPNAGSVLGCYQQPSGSRCTLMINDNGPGATTAKGAWATGWISLSSLTEPCGTGSGQFPLPSQLLTSGHIVVWKSSTVDNVTARPWVLYADHLTMYLFIQTGGSTYDPFVFGDIYSLTKDNKVSSDPQKCMIGGGFNDLGNTSNYAGNISATLFYPLSGHYICSVATNGFSAPISQTVSKLGNWSLTGAGNVSQIALGGTITPPNYQDNAYYISPVYIADQSSGLRGRMRGYYHLCHPYNSFGDGQIIRGSGDYFSKTFKCVTPLLNSGIACIEVSNTVETNDEG